MFPCIDTWKHSYFYFSGTIFPMKKLNYLLIASIFLLISVMLVFVFSNEKDNISFTRSHIKQDPKGPSRSINSPTPTHIILNQIPSSKILVNSYYAKQTFNNCGPASLSMALSYFNIHESQHVLGQMLRPYQHPTGDNDDKSVTFEEMAKKAQGYGLIAYHKPNGDIELLKKFITYDIPILTRTWLHINEDIGHYRVVKGFDEQTQTIIQDDSYEASNLSFSYEDFNAMWEKFDYEYLVLVPKDKQQIAETIIGENLDERFAWLKAVKRNEENLRSNPSDIYSRFNLSVAYYYLKEYQKSVDEFEKVENQLPFRTLWYQIEPILSYYELGHYDRVFAITDKTLNNHNRAFSELYILRGKMYEAQGNNESAKNEYEKAVFYNKNLPEAQTALDSVN